MQPLRFRFLASNARLRSRILTTPDACPDVNAPASSLATWHATHCRIIGVSVATGTPAGYALDDRRPSWVAGGVELLSEAEQAIHARKAPGNGALAALSRLLVRTKFIASAKGERLQASVRDLTRAEATTEAGIARGTTALEVLADIDTMVFAYETAAEVDRFREAVRCAIHRPGLERAPHGYIAGTIRHT